MARKNNWRDEYWLLLMQLYLRKPQGVKPTYHRGMVELSLELHIPPEVLHAQMLRLRQLDTPRMEQLWATYGQNPRKLSRGVQLFRQMKGFGQADMFYDGVEIQESFERDYRPLGEEVEGLSEEQGRLTPLMLIVILDLYFRLTPATMVKETPEVVELARKMKVGAQILVDVMECFQFCDPYLKRETLFIDPLMGPCEQVWQRFGNDAGGRLPALAAQMREYFE